MMRTLENNDWMVLNNIIYKIHTVKDINDMRLQVLEELKLLINFDSADFFLADRTGKDRLVEPVFYNCEDNYLDIYENLDYTRGVLFSGRTLIYRDTDIISDEQRTSSELYQKIYRPNNWHYSLQFVIAKHKELVGVITLYRTIGKNDFEYDDIFILDSLKDHLSYRLYKYKKVDGDNSDKYTVASAVEKFDLTRREQTILKALMDGKTNTEISSELVITENTLKKHILNIYRKLGINNRVQLFKLVKEKYS